MFKTQLTDLLGIRFPLIQGGMVWCSGWELASAVSNEGGLGVLGSGSMYPDVLEHHLKKVRHHTNHPFAVNLPLIYPQVEDHIDLILKYDVPIVITSAGNPAKYTETFKKSGIIVLHVVANQKFAQKAIAAGVDGLIVEGFEAGGHNGKDEITTLCLLPQIRKVTKLPVVAAGGVGSGEAMYALMAMGADGVQVGSRFAISKESSAHINFKKAVVDALDGDTILTLKELAPVRMLKNDFYQKVFQAYQNNFSILQLKELLGKGRSKKGIFEGDISEGELEIGQVSGSIDEILSVSEIFSSFKKEFKNAHLRMLQPI